jgi:hypothetical protein
MQKIIFEFRFPIEKKEKFKKKILGSHFLNLGTHFSDINELVKKCFYITCSYWVAKRGVCSSLRTCS